MQILQAGPSQATLRQQAMNEGMNNAIKGFGAYEQAKNERDATLRQQAMQIGQAKMDLVKAGYDVSKFSDEEIGREIGIQKPEEIGFRNLFGKKEEPQNYKIDLFGERTQEYKDRASAEKTANERKARLEESQINKNNRYRPQTNQNLALNPDGSPMTWEQKKQRESEISAESKAKEEARKLANPSYRLGQLSAEAQGKVGAIASGLQAIDQMGKAFNAGQTMDYVDANTPVIGNLLSDTDVTSAERTMSEVVGRLQSGGAIGVIEGKTFREMGPRRGDTKEEKIKKLAAQRDFLNNKLAGFQMKPEELPGLGFKTTYDSPVNKGNGAGSSAHAGGNSGPWSKFGDKSGSSAPPQGSGSPWSKYGGN